MSDNPLKSLADIFDRTFFRIPDFQRGYSWETEQLNDFWEDLLHLPENRSHYTGLLAIKMILPSSVSHLESWQSDLSLFKNNFTAYSVIDGQQRLTTSIIFINELLHYFDDNDVLLSKPKSHWQEKFLFFTSDNGYNAYIFGYEKDNPSDEYFKTKILNQYSSSSDKYPSNTLYTNNLKNAKEFFKQQLSHQDKYTLETLFKKLVCHFKFNFYQVNNELDICVIFETMNKRGKSLSNLELLKNRLIYLSTLLKDSDDNRDLLRKDIDNAWKTIYEYLGKNPDKKSNDDKFLKEHWIIYFKYNRKEADSYAKFLLEEHFTAKRVLDNQLSFLDIKQYAKSLQELVKYWFYLHNPQQSGYDEHTQEWLLKLNRIKMRAFSPLLTVALYQEKDNEKRLSLLKCVERFIFLVFLITKRPANTKNTAIYSYANQYYQGKLSLDKIIHQIALFTDGQHNKNDGWTNIDAFIEQIRDPKRKGYYDWSGLKYFLYEYELHLQQKADNNPKVTWAMIDKRPMQETIEHIYPQTANDDYWQARFGHYNTQEQKALLHHLGNLVLLSRSKNSTLQNKDFNNKKKSGDTGFFNGSHSEIEVATYAEWKASTIKERAIKMINFMDKRWDIRLNDDWQMSAQDIVGLDFIQNTKE